MSRLAMSLAAAPLLLCAVVLAACGGSSNSGNAAASGTNANQNASFQKYQQCLKDHGFTPPARPQGGGYGPPPGTGGAPPSGATPPPGGGQGQGGFRSPAFRKAMQACSQYRPQGQQGGPGGGGFGGGGGQAFTAYLSCLKSQGLKLGSTQDFRALRNLDRTDPKVQKALTACKSQAPQPPSGAPSGAAAQGSSPA